MSTEPSESSVGNPAASELDRLKADLLNAETRVRALRIAESKSWLVHDVLLYGGSFLTLWLSNAPAGAGWDVLIAAAPTALSALLREITGKQIFP